MAKQLSEMSLQELWHLFPIFLTQHNDEWDTWYEDEAALLSSVLPLIEVVRISHIGSTAIKSIMAKPIVDILVEVCCECDMHEIGTLLCSSGYRCMCEEENRISFNKGYTENGFSQKVFHIHLRFAGDNDELYFRDYMNESQLPAKQYETLKLSLAKKFKHNRDAYTLGKTDFIREQTEKAKIKYGRRY
ncbi:MAG: GrpB family protein [Oscillospiraceae bacterium]|nr:GrpB family protein [Oscillospiraceae bacterium]